jgi:hypothetical protein
MNNPTRENQIQEIATKIRDTGNTCVTNLYAVENKNTSTILNYKNNMFYTTRRAAREARAQILLSKSNKLTSSDVRIVTTDFVNVCPWKSVR